VRSSAKSKLKSKTALDPMSDVIDGKSLFNGSFNFRFGKHNGYSSNELIIVGVF
jgi:hypothetical protein